MKHGERFNYNYSKKRHYRRTIWNIIKRLVKPHTPGEPILYLSGAGDEDRKIILEKGFPEPDLVAVDRSKQVVVSLRARGIAAIDGDILDIAKNWGAKKVSVLSCDFCCDASKKITEQLMLALPQEHLSSAVVHLNFCRGRNFDWREWRELLRDITGLSEAIHRGFAMDVMIKCAVKNQLEISALVDGRKIKSAELDRASEWIFKGMDSQLFSYRSDDAGQYFDSITFRNPWHFVRAIGLKPPAEFFESFREQPLERKCAAASALHTRRWQEARSAHAMRMH